MEGVSPRETPFIVLWARPGRQGNEFVWLFPKVRQQMIRLSADVLSQ
jgi:hypothetical protein